MGESIRLTLWISTFTPWNAAAPTDGYTYVYTDVHITITSLSYRIYQLYRKRRGSINNLVWCLLLLND